MVVATREVGEAIDPPLPLGNYRAVVVRGHQGCVSGQLPLHSGELAYSGRVGAELTLAQGREAAALCARNALAQLRVALPASGPFIALTRLVGYVASAPDFFAQAAVLDAASDVLVAALGDRGQHTRAAIGVLNLPANAAVELLLEFVLIGNDTDQSSP